LATPQVPTTDPGPLSWLTTLPERFARFVLVGRWRTRIITGLLCVPLVLYAIADLPPRAHIALSLFLMAVGLIIARRFPEHRFMVVPISLAASTRYIWWRGTHTLSTTNPADTAASLLLFAAELYAWSTLLGGYFQTSMEKVRAPVPLPGPGTPLPSVDIYIPTYDEDPEILRTTVEAALSMDYPADKMSVYVLDDTPKPPYKQRPRESKEDFAARSKRLRERMQHLRALARSLGCGYLARTDNIDAKAGNLNFAMTRTRGDLVAVFDTDHAPTQSFLQTTIGYFVDDEKIALVQTPHHFYNPDPIERNLYHEGVVPTEGHLFYHRIQKGNDFWNSAFFCGSCAVMRRTALDEVGGFTTSADIHTVTEDAHTALKLHAAGWSSAYMPIPQAAGLATERVGDHVGQRIRWARGMAQIFAQDNPLLKRGLTLAQRLNYFNAAWHFFNGIPRLIFLLAPAAYLLFDVHPLLGYVREALIYALPHLFLAWLGAALMNRNTRHSFWPDVYETLLAPYTAVVTTVALFFPKLGKFNVTAKGALLPKASFDWRRAAPTLLFTSLGLASLVAAPVKWFRYEQDQDTIVIATLWNLLNLAILGGVIGACYERAQRRTEHRVDRRWPVSVRAAPERAAVEPEQRRWQGWTHNLSYGGGRMELERGAVLPEQLQITLKTEYGITLLADTMQQERLDDATVVRFKFRPLNSREHRMMTRNLFSSSDSWVHEDYTFDQPVRSALLVALSPLIAFLKKPRWVQRIILGAAEEQPLIELEVFEACPSCGAVPQTASVDCVVCGYSLARRLTDPPVRAPSPKPLGAMLIPGLFLFTALGLAIGNKPVVNAFEFYMSMERWTAVPFQTRLAELNQAHRELRALHRQLGEAVAGEGLAADDYDAFWLEWEGNLRDVQRDRALYGEAGSRAETAPIDRALYAAVLSMKAAGSELEDIQDGRGDRRLAMKLLQSADTSLDEAAQGLGIPLR